MKKNSKKQEKKQEKNYLNNCMLSLTAFEYIEKDNYDMMRCALYCGKDKDNNYKKSLPITVFINSDTEMSDDFEFTEKMSVDVVGSLSAYYTEKDGTTYQNVTLWAKSVCVTGNK